MKSALLLLVIAIGLVLAGCTDQPAPAKQAPASPAPQNDSGWKEVPPPANNAPKQETPVVQPPAQPPAPEEPKVGVSEFCTGKTGRGQVECYAMQATGAKDVKVCTGLAARQDRFDCIAQWCGSAARDFTQCSSLTDYDDRLGCLNKCNPNSNT